MKKYISLFSFIALFFVGMQQMNAQDATQNRERPEDIAKMQTLDLHNMLELSGDQQRAVFKVLVDAEQNIAALDASNTNITQIQKTKGSIADLVATRLKEILSAEQYLKYLESLKKVK
jgi:hypothetical protein